MKNDGDRMRRVVTILAAAVTAALLTGAGAAAAASQAEGLSAPAALRGAAPGSATPRPGPHRGAEGHPQRPAKTPRRAPQHPLRHARVLRKTRTHSGKQILAPQAHSAHGAAASGTIHVRRLAAQRRPASDRARGRAPPRRRHSSRAARSARPARARSRGARSSRTLRSSRAGTPAGDPPDAIARSFFPSRIRTFGEPDCGGTCVYAGDPDAATGPLLERTERRPGRFRTGRPEGAAVRAHMPSLRGDA